MGKYTVIDGLKPLTTLNSGFIDFYSFFFVSFAYELQVGAG